MNHVLRFLQNPQEKYLEIFLNNKERLWGEKSDYREKVKFLRQDQDGKTIHQSSLCTVHQIHRNQAEVKHILEIDLKIASLI